MNTDRRVGSTNISPAFVEHESGEGDTRGNMTSGKKFEREWLDSLTQKKQEKRFHNTTTARVPCNTYFVIDSKDRFQTSSSKNTVDPTTQNEWNNFVLQKPQNISSVFPNRISVTEVMFPWQIPNIIKGVNDTLYLYIQPKAEIATASNSANWEITIPGSGFYTPVELTAEINDVIDAQVTKNGFTANLYFQIEYDVDEGKFSWITERQDQDDVIMISPLPIGFATTAQDVANYAQTYFSQASLLRTLGFNWSQVSQLYTPSTSKNTGNPTNCAYTNYVDIVSTKLNFYSEKDSTSSQDGATNNLLCRIYCASETSQPYTDENGVILPVPCQPFNIYRQFKNPKNIRWDNEATIDWIDIKVLDEYGNEVPLPEANGPTQTSTVTPPMKIPFSTLRIFNGSYQDFQITLLASEE
jgi:hypothetical protein